jgi:UDP-N-acetylenolpyruvoylglucosamine reductase
LQLMEIVKEKVMKRSGIELEPEIKIIGDVNQ